MGTRSEIGVEHTDGTVTFVYCHWDSYPDHHLPILTRCYPTHEQAVALVTPGDMSSLGETVGEKHNFDARPLGQCNYYGRDRGEQNTEPRVAASFDAFNEAANNGYAYCFRGGEWWFRSSKAWKKASEFVNDEEEV